MNIFKQLAPIKCGFRGAVIKSCRACLSLFRSSPDTSVEVHAQEHEVVIALGSNVGDRLHNFNEALQLMKKSGIHIARHACLYETEPAYVTDQPRFLNSAVRGVTKLGPHELLGVLKKIEKDLGRTDGIRYGPRPIDLDILFYGKFKISSEILTVPHERIWERPFVMAPMMDLIGSSIDSDTVARWHDLSVHSGGLFESWEKLGGESLIGKDGLKRVLPVGDRLWDWSERTSVMGILNLTPDSFSDGGKFQSVDAAVSQVHFMISEGADIIDLGAQSTRPMAPRVSAEEELDRLIPILEAVLKMPEAEGKLLSVDTFYSEVASEAVSKGAHLINDVSGGQLDSKMHSVVACLQVPYVTMHMRGDPSTMQNSKNLQYDDVCKQVGSELYLRARDAEIAGIPAWRVIIDPGIRFSKKKKKKKKKKKNQILFSVLLNLKKHQPWLFNAILFPVTSTNPPKPPLSFNSNTLNLSTHRLCRVVSAVISEENMVDSSFSGADDVFKLTYLEGNSWLWDVGGLKILVDPILVGNLDFGIPWLYDAAKKFLKSFQLSDLPEVDCLLITQSLDDHCHLKTLKPLSQKFPNLRVIATPNAKIQIKIHREQISDSNKKAKKKKSFVVSPFS